MVGGSRLTIRLPLAAAAAAASAAAADIAIGLSSCTARSELGVCERRVGAAGSSAGRWRSDADSPAAAPADIASGLYRCTAWSELGLCEWRVGAARPSARGGRGRAAGHGRAPAAFLPGRVRSTERELLGGEGQSCPPTSSATDRTDNGSSVRRITRIWSATDHRTHGSGLCEMGSSLAILHDLRDVAGYGQAGRQARRVYASHLDQRRNLRIPANHEISERLGGRV